MFNFIKYLYFLNTYAGIIAKDRECRKEKSNWKK